MKKIISILVLVVGFFSIIMAVGLFETFGLGFLSASNNYTGNGVSFEYPADYNITEVKNNSTFLTATNTKNPNLTFQVSKSPVNGSVYHGMSLNESAQTFENYLKSRGWYIILADTTVSPADNTTGEEQAYSISYTEKMQLDTDSVDGHIMMFDKNGIRYTIDFQGKGKHYDGWAFLKVTTSFKVV